MSRFKFWYATNWWSLWFQLGRRSYPCEILLVSEKLSLLGKGVYAVLSSHCNAQDRELLL